MASVYVADNKNDSLIMGHVAVIMCAVLVRISAILVPIIFSNDGDFNSDERRRDRNLNIGLAR